MGAGERLLANETSRMSNDDVTICRQYDLENEDVTISRQHQREHQQQQRFQQIKRPVWQCLLVGD